MITDPASIRTLITHAHCPDGMASAILVRDALPEVEVRFLSYQSRELAELEATPGQLWVDFSPPPDRAPEFVDAGAIVLDHHKSAREVVELFGERGIYADEDKEPGVSGAVLAYRHVWEPAFLRLPPTGALMRAEEFARLAGVRDTWQKGSCRWVEACAQAEMLRLYGDLEDWDFRPFGGAGSVFDNGPMLRDRTSVGSRLFDRHMQSVKRAVRGACRWHWGRVAVAIIEDTRLASDASDLLDADLVVAFSFTAEREPTMKLSLRSRGDVDCAALAAGYGGGGHRSSAGFEVKLGALPPLPFVPVGPYELVKALIDGEAGKP